MPCRDLCSSLGEVGALTPELSGMADVAMAAASALRGLGRALSSSILMIGATVVIGGLIAAYAALTAATKRNEESQKEFAKAIEETNKKISEVRQPLIMLRPRSLANAAASTILLLSIKN